MLIVRETDGGLSALGVGDLQRILGLEMATDMRCRFLQTDDREISCAQDKVNKFTDLEDRKAFKYRLCSLTSGAILPPNLP